MGLNCTKGRLVKPTRRKQQAHANTAVTPTIPTKGSVDVYPPVFPVPSSKGNGDVDSNVTLPNKPPVLQDLGPDLVELPWSSATSVTQAHLEHYVLEAEKTVLGHIPRRRPLFRRVPDIAPPTLSSDCENRILVYPGSFNPPHLGHLALMWHAFLCTDDKTIAVMFLPMGEGSLAKKSNVEDEGRSFKLSLHQRTQLLQDDVLGRFTWVFPTTPYDCRDFMRKVQELAAADGFKIAFPSLHGGDHFDDYRGTLGWGTGSIVASNVTRSLKFIDSSDRPMDNFPECGAWRKMHSAFFGPQWASEGTLLMCWPCWPCKKLRSVCPEYFAKNSQEGECTLHRAWTSG